MKRGDVLKMSFDGTGISNESLCLVVQNDRGNMVSPNTIVLPILQEGHSFLENVPKEHLVAISFREIFEKKVRMDGVWYIICSYPMTFSKKRMVPVAESADGIIGSLHFAKMKEVNQTLRELIRLKEEDRSQGLFKQGDIVTMSLDGIENEQRGMRPCVVVHAENDRLVVIPMTKAANAKKPLPTHVVFDKEDCVDKLKSLAEPSIFLGEHPVTLPISRVKKSQGEYEYIGSLKKELFQKANESIFISLQLPREKSQVQQEQKRQSI